MLLGVGITPNTGTGGNTEGFTDDMIVKGGNVGIGTTNPGAKLEITKAQSDGVSGRNSAHLYLSNNHQQIQQVEHLYFYIHQVQHYLIMD